MSPRRNRNAGQPRKTRDGSRKTKKKGKPRERDRRPLHGKGR